MTEKATGRPTLYSEEMLQRAEEYINRFSSNIVDKEADATRLEVIPSVAGLSLYLGVNRSTVYEWGRVHEEFSHTLERLNALQEASLLNGGLQGRLNANIAKLALANHGYSDKIQTDMTSSDGSMKPTRIELVAPDES